MNDAALDSLDRVLAAWPTSGHLQRAVDESVARFGYAARDVQAQLEHVSLRCSARVMRDVRALECGPSELRDMPATTLVLAAGRVPGLSIEGIAAALSVGAMALVRPSRDETVLHHLLACARDVAPELAGRIEHVGGDDERIPWGRIASAIVFGGDSTIELVMRELRERGPRDAERRVAAYGSRRGIAVIDVRTGPTPDDQLARLADDVLTFRQAGCMSPSTIITLGDGVDGRPMLRRLRLSLDQARSRHRAPGVDDRISQRHASDEDVLAAIARGDTPVSDATLVAGDARLSTLHAVDEQQVIDVVLALGSLRQTAVIAAPACCYEPLARLLRDAGITRTCRPGEAHTPDPRWPHDGVGRIAPLARMRR